MSRVTPNPAQIDRFAKWMPSSGQVQAFDFCSGGEGVLFPPARAAGALESFFLNAAHQYGFWYMEDGRYTQPMIAAVDGVNRKGSDYLFYCFQRALNNQADFFSIAQMKEMTDADWDAVFHDDHGRNPLPMWPEHLELINQYVDWFEQNESTPQALIDAANASEQVLATFLELVGQVPGYREDPMQKKLMLLAVMLENRPEGFLRVNDPDAAVPIIDYHLQRSALRTGLVQVHDDDLRKRLLARAEVSASDEQAIREATYQAIETLVKQSGLSVAAIDYFFFTNRTRCPEMTAPQCEVCPVNDICAHETELFQPIFRTTAY